MTVRDSFREAIPAIFLSLSVSIRILASKIRPEAK